MENNKTTFVKKIPKKKICSFCSDFTIRIDYKTPEMLSRFTTERGKIKPRRLSGLCAKHQRELTKAIKRARMLALLSFTTI